MALKGKLVVAFDVEVEGTNNASNSLRDEFRKLLIERLGGFSAEHEIGYKRKVHIRGVRIRGHEHGA